MHGTARQSSVISQDDVELLAIDVDVNITPTHAYAYSRSKCNTRHDIFNCRRTSRCSWWVARAASTIWITWRSWSRCRFCEGGRLTNWKTKTTRRRWRSHTSSESQHNGRLSKINKHRISSPAPDVGRCLFATATSTTGSSS